MTRIRAVNVSAIFELGTYLNAHWNLEEQFTLT